MRLVGRQFMGMNGTAGLAGMAAALWLAAAGTAVAQGTPEEQDACRPDVFRLCSAYIPNVDAIVGCLRAKGPELNPLCRRVMFAAPATAPRPVARKAKRKAKRA
jgi:hypothetical protein